MAQPHANGETPSRRATPRLQLGIGARFDTLDGRQSVRLIDLSQGGAHVILSEANDFSEGVLAWLGFDSYAVVAWQRDDHVGLAFDRPLPLGWLVATRKRAPSVVQEEAMGAELARAWVSGGIADD
jgi:hypothetical protein